MKSPFTKSQLEELRQVLRENQLLLGEQLLDHLLARERPESLIRRLLLPLPELPSSFPTSLRPRIARRCVVCNKLRTFDERGNPTEWPWALYPVRWADSFRLEVLVDWHEVEDSLQIAGCPSHVGDVLGCAGVLNAGIDLWLNPVSDDDIDTDIDLWLNPVSDDDIDTDEEDTE